MIDRLTRDRYAELLRRFIAGQVTNFEYEDRFDEVAIDLDIADPAVEELFRVMWFPYCDIRKHKMTGVHAIEGENRQTVLQFLLFLPPANGEAALHGVRRKTEAGEEAVP